MTNTIKIITDYDEQWGEGLTLSIDDIPLNKYFEECMDDDIRDSVALPWKDPHDLGGLALLWDYPFYWKGNKRFVWFLSDSSEDEVVPRCAQRHGDRAGQCDSRCFRRNHGGVHGYL